MKLFKCHHCGQLIYFENTRCVRCGYALGFWAERESMVALITKKEGIWQAFNDPALQFRYCANATYDACNWLVPAESEQPFCVACQLNRTVPNLDDPIHLQAWRKLEVAKRRLVYTLLRLDLPVMSRFRDPEHGLIFDFLADSGVENGQGSTIMTGHNEGLITINLSEADDAWRTQQRQSLAEPYRTLTGHFRHEVGHYYWELFTTNHEWLHNFRTLFGDEQRDYAEALNQHYQTGAPANWQEHYISAYATMHPWEDWAESWAHYLHIVDTLETAYAFGLEINPRLLVDDNLTKEIDFNAYKQENFDEMIAAWLPVTFAINSLNRSMGQPDLYPFTLSQPAMEKIRFVHNSIHQVDLTECIPALGEQSSDGY